MSRRHPIVERRSAESIGPVPVDGQPDMIWPTWREAIKDAAEGVEHAYDRRRRVFEAAYGAGLSFRKIGDAAGLSAATIHKIIGSQRGPGDDSLLDSPAAVLMPKEKHG